MIGILGSINLDLVVRTQHLPKPGETVPGHGFNKFPGGKGANQALAAIRAGADVRFFGAVGKDDFAAAALHEFRTEGTDLSHIKTVDENTGIAIILVDGQGENVITVVPGANASIDAAMADAMLETLTAGDIVLLQQEIPAPALHQVLQGAKAKSLTTILNIAPIIAETAALAAKADIVIANETELAALIGIETLHDDAIEQAALAHAKAHQQTLIVTLGAKGACAATEAGAFFTAPGLVIKPVDTVGAGDAFCGYLASALDRGEGLEQALHRAAIAGSLACLNPGAQPAIPNASDVDAAQES